MSTCYLEWLLNIVDTIRSDMVSMFTCAGILHWHKKKGALISYAIGYVYVCGMHPSSMGIALHRIVSDRDTIASHRGSDTTSLGVRRENSRAADRGPWGSRDNSPEMYYS